MIPLVDTHCHLLAGLDDGPRTAADALEMCRMAWEQGTRAVAATAHLAEQWPDVTPERIRAATRRLASQLDEFGLPLAVYSSAEVMVRPDLEHAWQQDELLSVADRRTYLLIELPPGLFLDLRDMVRGLRELGIRPILAHPERHPELLGDAAMIEELVHLGCLVQISSDSIAENAGWEQTHVLKRWVRRGIVHLVGSDGHSPTDRPPSMAEAYWRIAQWAGPAAADRICSTNGIAVLEGLPLEVPKPPPRRRRWFFRFDKASGFRQAYYPQPGRQPLVSG
ncbi:MAG: hypothetical protein A2V70_04475 [Planctomycetes bacterium RBG_13_63_9]|nr:MAG: hypothetical protein A2V70_04475 [Planctomycetes bacterium RBG_13_63_9]